MTRFAVIPARGGSQRIPRKNVVAFDGKPLIAWTIEAALETQLFDRVFVSTDDQEIAEISDQHGASVPFLRSAHADHHSPVSQATIHMLEQLATDGQRCDVVVQLFAACPLRNAADIHAAVEHFDRNKLTFQLSCYEFGWAHPWWAARLDADMRPAPLFPEQSKMRSQDLPVLYCPTGATWIANADALVDAGTFYGPDHRYFPMPSERAVDIDEPKDLDFAHALLTASRHS